MKRLPILLATLMCLSVSAPAMSQGLLVAPDQRLPRPFIRPRPQQPTLTYAIDEIGIKARIRDQVAEVQVSQTFVNTGTRQIQVQFMFPLPYDGAIESLTLLVDGKELTAKLMPADQARSKYEEIVRRSQDPALLEWMGHGMFQTSVFPVPAGAKRTVTLNYDQLLRKNQGATDFIFPLSNARYTAGAVKKLDISVSIESGLPIKNIYSPSHDLKIERSGKKNAVVTSVVKNSIPTEDFRLFYDANPKKLGTSVLSYRPNKKEDGYFLLLTTPQISSEAEPIEKNVVFVVDKSGSMSGEKIKQAKSALKFVLNNLSDGDRFNIVVYDSSVESFRSKLVRFDEETRQTAIGFVEGIYAGGGTNINGALTSAMGHLKNSERPSYIIFLTDGLPTSGETNESKIAVSARRLNKNHARLLSFGVGYDVNSRLLDRLARDNSGASEYVRPNEDIETAVSRVYRRIQSPVLADVKVDFEFDELKTSEGKPVNRVYPGGRFDLFAGEQLVVVGRYRKSGKAKVTIRGAVGDDKHQYDFPAELIGSSDDQTNGFVEKLWVIRRIGEIIDEIDLNGKNDELVKELVQLSTRHGILTQYTSFLADETVRPTDLASSSAFRSNSGRASSDLRLLERADGESGVRQRAGKQLFKNAQNASGFGADQYGRGSGSLPAPGGVGGGFGGRPGGLPAATTAPSSDASVVSGATAQSTVRQVGQMTLYKRGKMLVTPETAELDVTKDKDKLVIIKRYSKEYFALVKANNTQQNQLLSNQGPDEELLVKLRGKNYLIK